MIIRLVCLKANNDIFKVHVSLIMNFEIVVKLKPGVLHENVKFCLLLRN